jgi:hypothetical protein
MMYRVRSSTVAPFAGSSRVRLCTVNPVCEPGVTPLRHRFKINNQLVMGTPSSAFAESVNLATITV